LTQQGDFGLPERPLNFKIILQRRAKGEREYILIRLFCFVAVKKRFDQCQGRYTDAKNSEKKSLGTIRHNLQKSEKKGV